MKVTRRNFSFGSRKMKPCSLKIEEKMLVPIPVTPIVGKLKRVIKEKVVVLEEKPM